MAFNAWPRRGYILSEDCVYPGDDDYEGDNPWPGEDNNWRKAVDHLQDEIDALSDTVDDITIPTKVSELENDSGFQTAAQVQSAIANKSDKTPRVAMAASDTTPALYPNKLYVFPEMATLTPTFATPTDSTIVNEYHFIFTSGATATTLTLPATILQPNGFSVEANMHYEISILEGAMTAQGWAVTA